MEFLKRLFASGDYMPHGFCYLWNAHLVWLHVVSDSLIALSYFAIPAVLLWFVFKRRDFPFNWMFVLFGVFIVACGMTHVMEVWNLWHANYWLSGAIKAVTAAASVSTACLLTNLAPRVMAMPAFDQLIRSHSSLEQQVGDLHNEKTKLLIREAAYRDQAALLDLTYDAIFVRDLNSRLTYWNRAATELYGWAREEACGKVSHVILRTEFPKPLAEIELEVFAAGSWDGELTHCKRDGSKIIVDSRWSLATDAAGKPVAILESNRDITARKRMEGRFQNLLEAAPDAIVIVNHSGLIELVNAQTEKLFGYSRAELIGQPVETLVPEKHRAVHVGHRRDYAQASHTREMSAGIDLRARRKDGTEFPVEISLSPLETEHGILITSAIRDITKRREATDKIQKLNSELQQKIADLDAQNGELESFSYSVSHDLRAPLRHIDGFARILQEDCAAELSPDARRYLKRITEGANRMGSLIDDLLALGRVGRREIAFRSVRLNEMVTRAIGDLPPGTESRAIEWKIESLGEARWDPGLLKLVFSNLLSNAVKFTRTRQSTVIEVGKRNIDGRSAFFVRDNGVGFDPRYADKLFGVFQRLHRQEDFEGTGIGLATVRRIIQRHGGDAWAESQPDQGATFLFTLPCDSGTASSSQGNGSNRQ
jgi:PAS domain S-box-containing protein